jgi:hypothetical protein
MTEQIINKEPNLELVKLKIKAKNLAEESRIIRKEEKKLSGWQKRKIQDHRRWDVRNEARATQLAIAFIKGKTFRSVELKTRDRMDHKHAMVLERLTMMAIKYGYSTENVVQAWFNLR